MNTSLELVRDIHASIARGGIPAVPGALALDVRWTTAAQLRLMQ